MDSRKVPSEYVASENHRYSSKSHSTSTSPRYDSGLGSLPTYSSMDQHQPIRPKLVGGAAIHEETGEESGIFSGDVYAESDSVVAVQPMQASDAHDTAVSFVVTSTSKAFESMSISSAPRETMAAVIRTEKPARQSAATKSKGGRPGGGRVRRPHRNYSNVSMTGSRSSSPGLQSLPQDNSGVSGVFSNSHIHSSLPQSWETSGYGSQPSSLSSVDMFSGSHGINTSSEWPSIDIFELQQNVQYFLPNRDGDTGFHLAVIHGENDLLDKLLFIMSRDNRLRSVIDEQNNLYQTALHLATHMQHTEMIRKLLIAGASLNITDHKGNTPLHIAARFSSTKCLEEIIRYMSVQTILQVATIKNNEGLTCIHIAAKQGNMDTLRKFKSLGVDVDMQDLNSGKTALHSVIEKGSLSDVQFMLETCRANINATTYTGCTPLHIASGRGDIILTAYLLSMGANPDLVTDEGDTALDIAGSDQVMTLLTKAAALRWLY